MSQFPHRLRALAAGLTLTLAATVCLPAGAHAQEDATSERLAQLEEQIVDLQVAIDTLQSLGGGAQAAPPPFAGSSGFGDGDMAERVGALETQIRAITGQVEQLGQRIADLSARLGQAAPDGPDRPGEGDPRRQSFADHAVPDIRMPPAAFGTTTVTPDRAEPAGDRPPAFVPPQTDGPQRDSSPPWQTAPRAEPERVASLPSGGAREMYDGAYEYLLQRDYDSAEVGFRHFLQAHGESELASDAHYWLGETYYVRGQYREAADAFLQGYRRYGSGSKAPDSLLKLGMSLNQIDERDAACDTYGELASRFPDAPEHIRQRAEVEHRRAGC